MRTLMTLGLIASACTSGCLIVAKHEISALRRSFTSRPGRRPAKPSPPPISKPATRRPLPSATSPSAIKLSLRSPPKPPPAATCRLTRAALGAISDFTVRDSAADAAAMVLAQNGMRTQATEIARTMSDFTRRDATLQKLSTR